MSKRKRKNKPGSSLCGDSSGLLIDTLPQVCESIVLGFVGTGEFFYMSNVCKRWRLKYLKHWTKKYRYKTSVTAVLTSISRLQLAILHGLNMYTKSYNTGYNEIYDRPSVDYSSSIAYAAGKHAEKDLILWIKHYSKAIFYDSVLPGAIAGKRFQLVKWLHKKHRCDWRKEVVFLVAETGHLPLLQYVHQESAGKIIRNKCKHEFTESVLHGDNARMLSWCARKHLLAPPSPNNDFYTIAYYNIGCSPEVLCWLFKHGYRLPPENDPDAQEDEYAEMMKRHQKDDLTSSSDECELDGDDTCEYSNSSDSSYSSSSDSSSSV